MKTYSEKTAAAVMNSLLRAARKTPREGLHNAWTDEQGRTCALDGFRAYCLNTAPAGMLETWTCKPDPAAAAARRADNNKILAHVFAALEAGNVAEMPAPDADAVKTFLDAEKKEPAHQWLYDLGPEFPLVNVKYLHDIIRLFPVAKWYVDADPYARMVRPIYIVADEGRACLLPCRNDKKPCKAPETPAAAPVEKPAPAPAAAPETPAEEAPWKYFIYSRPAGEKRFLLTNLNEGTVGMKKIYAPRYMERDVEKVKLMLDRVADENPGAIFQLRKLDGKTVVYTAATVTPETFAAMIAA